MKTKITFKKSNSDSLIAKYELYRSTSKDGLFAIENKIDEITEFDSSETVSFVDQSSTYGAILLWLDGSDQSRLRDSIGTNV